MPPLEYFDVQQHAHASKDLKDRTTSECEYGLESIVYDLSAGQDMGGQIANRALDVSWEDHYNLEVSTAEATAFNQGIQPLMYGGEEAELPGDSEMSRWIYAVLFSCVQSMTIFSIIKFSLISLFALCTYGH